MVLNEDVIGTSPCVMTTDTILRSFLHSSIYALRTTGGLFIKFFAYVVFILVDSALKDN